MTRHFPSRKEALAYLEDNALHCVTWNDGVRLMSAIYWSGKRRIQPASAPVSLSA